MPQGAVSASSPRVAVAPAASPPAASVVGRPAAPGSTQGADAPYCVGVGVVVDGGALDSAPLGPASALACAPVDGAVSAHDAASAAGVELQGTDQWGAAFVCRVDGRPAPDEDVRRADGSIGTESCLRTPSQGAYWSLWTSRQGSTWVYATRGATSLDVAPGDVVGFVFVTSEQPGPPRVSPSDALEGVAPDGWASSGSLQGAVPDESGADGSGGDEAGRPSPGSSRLDGTSPEASTPADAPGGVVALVGLGLAVGLLVLAGARVRSRRS